MFETEERPCYECQGSGKDYAGDPQTGEGVEYGTCPVCGGTGYVLSLVEDEDEDE